MPDRPFPSDLAQARRLFELTTLLEVCHGLRLGRDPLLLTFDYLTSIVGLTGARWGLLWLRGENGAGLDCVHRCGLGRNDPGSLVLSLDWTDRFLGDPSAVRFPGADGAETDSSLPPRLCALDPALLVPLVSPGRVNGLVALGRNFLERPWDPPLLELLGDTAFLTSLTLDRLAADGLCATAHWGGNAELCDRYPALATIVGGGSAVQDLHRQLVTVAAAACTVLLEGETGTGKQLAAEVLHRLGPRREAPFIEVDCSSIPENLIESELFGHARGAFTGADRERKGVFELADSGTLFLDEVSNLPWTVQGRLLRVLQERRFRPVGGSRTVAVDVRVIAATNGDLREEVRCGRFREDLFYRLYVYPIRIPPLRERREDIPRLTALFLRQGASENGLPIPVPTAGFLERLQEYDFPGNIRELRHLLERCILRAGGGPLPASMLDEFETLVPVMGDARPPRRIPAADLPGTPLPLPPAAVALTRGGLGSWVVEVLRTHAFNIKETARRLEELARHDPYAAPPVIDRGTLTGYLQGECLRLYLETGEVDRIIDRLGGGDERAATAVATRVRRIVETARSVARAAPDRAGAVAAVRQRFGKLPSTYHDILRQVAESARAPAASSPLPFDPPREYHSG